MLDKKNIFEKSPVKILIPTKSEIKIEIEEPKKSWTRSEALKTAQQKYYNKNKKKLVADQLEYNYKYVRQEFVCECKDVMTVSAKFSHLRSKRHEKRMDHIKKGIDPNKRPCYMPYTCECGSQVLHKNRKQHYISKKHQKYIKESLFYPTECIVIENKT